MKPWLIIACCLGFLGGIAQSAFEAGVYGGSVVPNHRPFPTVKPQWGIHAAWSRQSVDQEWAAWYNYPKLGVYASFARMGNTRIHGYGATLAPMVEFSTGPPGAPKKQWHFRLALGMSHFNRQYDAIANPENWVVGSRITWGFHAALLRDIWVLPAFKLRAFGAFHHGSNGHVQLPNFGINSAVFGFLGNWGNRCTLPGERSRRAAPRAVQHFVFVRSGVGIHEYGGTIGPVGTPKRPVFLVSAGGGWQWRKHLQFRAGFTARYYGTFADHIRDRGPHQFTYRPHLNASSLHFLLGIEFLIGRVSIDVEGMLTLWRPYFHQWNRDFEDKAGVDFWLSQLFPTSLGLRLYAINPLDSPRWNGFIAAHIEANFGEADFSSASLGMLRYFGHP